MKRTASLLVLLLILFFTVPVTSAWTRAGQVGNLELTITEVDWRPATIQAGQELFVIATIEAAGDLKTGLGLADGDPVPTGRIRVLTLDEPAKSVAMCQVEANGIAGLNGDDKTTFSCSMILPIEGSYELEALVLGVDGQSISNEFVSRIEVAPFETSLPSELASLFAGLGLFAAVMLVMALGTEVVIDSVKVAFGLKTKIESAAALEQMERLLPGQLASLGASAAAQDQLRLLVANMKETLEPVKSGAQVSNSIRQGRFSEAFKSIQAVIPDEVVNKVREILPDEWAAFKSEATKQLGYIIDQITGPNGLKLDDITRNELLGKIQDQIAAANLASLEVLFTSWSADLLEAWLQSRRDQLLHKSRSEAIQLFEEELEPYLKDLGLSDSWLDAGKSKLDVILSAVDSQAIRVSDTYLNSLRNLLDSVEKRRFEMVSPSRKLWRRLRKADAVSGTVAALALLWITFSVLTRPSLTIARLETGVFWLDWLYSVVVGSVIAGLFMGIPWLVGGLVCVYEEIGVVTTTSKLRQSMQELPEALRNNKPLALVEISWNWLIGREVDPAKLDEPTSFEKIVGATLSGETLAQVLMARSDQQRDEESTRLRWMRILSLGTGIVLAFLLQIDAADLLDTALPGISSTVNKLFVVDGVTLHGLWDVLPTTLDFSAGMLLTGMAASAGSKFWHDFLGRLQSTKETAESAAQALQEVKELTSSAKK